ncbi:MAG TPA: PQQ-binding-like beta-propeller repeat protein [Verrucomicrobiae bacterium]|jgi:outer membrane protein assembly factor BamB
MRSHKSNLSWLLAAWLCLGAGLTQAAEGNGWEKLWSVTLPDHYNESSPALAPDGTVYQGSFYGWLFAVTHEGKVKWKFKAGAEIRSSPAVAPDGTIYFGSRDRKLYALNPDGKLKWSFKTGGWVDASPAIAVDGTVYFGSWDNNFYALTADGKLKWQFATSNLIYSSPAIGADGTLYFGSHDKNLYALTPDGKLKWKFITGGQVDASPTIAADGTIYISANDGSCHALRPDGTELWHLHTGGYSGSSPVLNGDGNLFLTAGINFTSLSHEGKMRWQLPSEFPLDNISGASAANGLIYVSFPWQHLGTLDDTGKWKREFRTDSDSMSSPNLDASGVIYACDGFILYALKPLTNAAPPAKSSWPLWRADAQHTGRVQTVK